MVVYIRNMVCPRCIRSVEQILKDNRMQANFVRLGEVELKGEPTEAQLRQLARYLKEAGFELLDDQKKQLIEKVKTRLIQKVQEGEVEEHFSISKYVSEHLLKEYSAISKLFSEVEGITVEQFFILQKIEKIKEWLVYNELSLNQMGVQLGYSSTQHLSTQFKRLTGMTPSQFKQLGASHRKSIDAVK